MNSLWILAQASPNSQPSAITAEPVSGQTATTAITSAPNTPGKPMTGAQPQKSMLPTFALIAVMFILMYFMMVRGPRKKQQEQRKMVQSLKKNDRVQTIGGMLGTILDVKDDEVLVKVDEGNNTKIWFVTGAISRVLTEEKK